MKAYPSRDQSRRGVAAVELAILAPFLIFLLVIAVDFGRVYFQTITVANAAEVGALYGSDSPARAADSGGIRAAVEADLGDLVPASTIGSVVQTGSDGYTYVVVTVSTRFRTVTRFPGVPDDFLTEKTCRMMVKPTTPRPGSYSF